MHKGDDTYAYLLNVYQDYVDKKSPNSPIFKNCFNAFWVGGLICSIGQIIFDFENYQYNLNQVYEDINKYGIFTYDELKHLMSYEEYNAFNFKFFKISIEKGLISWDDFYNFCFLLEKFRDDFIFS